MIYSVEEYILNGTNGDVGEFNGHWEFDSKEKAINAVYSYLLEEVEPEDVKDRTTIWNDEIDSTCIQTKYGDDYGLYDCRYEIYEVPINSKIEH